MMCLSVIVYQNEFIHDCCSVKPHNRPVIIPISLSRPYFIPDNTQVSAAFDKHTGSNHRSDFAKSGTFVIISGLFPVPRSLQIVNRLLPGCILKRGLNNKEHVAPLIRFPSEMLLCHLLREARWLAVKEIQTIGLRAYDRT